MSGIRALDSLSGKISGESVLKGTLSGIESLNGSICVTREYDTYSGDYKVVPKASGSQILNTANPVTVLQKINCWPVILPTTRAVK